MKIDLDTTFTNVIGDPNNIAISCNFYMCLYWRSCTFHMKLPRWTFSLINDEVNSHGQAT